jgi:hypothetical protein
LSSELENQAVLGLVIDENSDELTIEMALAQVNLRRRVGPDFSSAVSFIASHFDGISESEMKSIDEDILGHVLLSSELKIQSEDWLCELIWKLVDGDRSYFSLLEFVELEFVSVPTVVRFIEAWDDFRGFLNVSMLKRLGRRLIADARVPKSFRPRPRINERPFM